jgi:type VI secretion system protein ImpL
VHRDKNYTGDIANAKQRRFSGRRGLRWFQSASLIVAALLVVTLAVDAIQLYQYRLRAEKSLIEIKRLTPREGAAISCSEQDPTIWRILSKLTDISQAPKMRAIPASLGEGHMSRLTETVAEPVFRAYILPVLKCRLTERKAVLYAEFNNSLQPRTAEMSVSISASTGDSSGRNLQQFASQLLRYQRAITNFRRLAKSPDKLDDAGAVFKRLLGDLYDQPIPSDISFKKGELIAAALSRENINIEASSITTGDLPDEAFTKLGQLADNARTRIQDMAETVPVELMDRAIQSGEGAFQSVQKFGNWMAYVQNAWLNTDSNNNPCGALNKQLSELQSLDATEGLQLDRRNQVLAQFSPELCDEPVRQALFNLQVAPLGKLFDGDTASTLAFSTQLREWNQQLTQLLALNLLSQKKATNNDQAAGDMLIWKEAPLDTAVRNLLAFQDFRQHWWPQTAEPFYAAEFRRRLALTTQQLIAQAQTRQAFVPGLASSSAVDPEAKLKAQIHSFQIASGLILQLQSLLHQQGDRGSEESLIKAGDDFVQKQLTALKGLTNKSLYQPAQAPQWASANFAAAMFGYSEPRQLKSYLQSQRQRAKYLAQNYAQPLVSYLLNSGAITDTQSNAQWWFDTLLALRQYQHQQPGNNVAQLEQFIGKQMAGLNSSHCNNWLTQPAIIYSAGGLFAQRHQQLDKQIRSHCEYYDNLSVAESYQALAKSFEQQLAGRFPFAAADKAGSNDLEASAIQHFFSGFRQQWFNPGQGKNLLEDLKALAAAQPELNLNSAMDFVEKLTRLSRFWRATSGAGKSLSVPLSVEFAALPRKSVGLEQIIEWQFESGSSRLAYPNGDTRAQWQPGDVLRLSLRWASESEYAPISSVESPALIDQDRKSAAFISKGPWGLFEWLSEFGGNTNNGALLGFHVPVRIVTASAKPVPDSSAATAGAVTSRVNLRLMFVNPVDDAKPYIPAPPVPPVYAPGLPATLVSKTGGS